MKQTSGGIIFVIWHRCVTFLVYVLSYCVHVYLCVYFTHLIWDLCLKTLISALVNALPPTFRSSMCHLGPAAQTRPPASPAARWAPGAGTPSPPAPTSSRTSATTVCSRPSARETSPRSSWPATSWRAGRWDRGHRRWKVDGGNVEMW